MAQKGPADDGLTGSHDTGCAAAAGSHHVAEKGWAALAAHSSYDTRQLSRAEKVYALGRTRDTWRGAGAAGAAQATPTGSRTQQR